MVGVARSHLAPEYYEKFERYLDDSRIAYMRDVSFDAVVSALSACCTHMLDPKSKAEAFEAVATFDMSHMGDVIKGYEKSCLNCVQRESQERRKVAEELQRLDLQIAKSASSK